MCLARPGCKASRAAALGLQQAAGLQVMPAAHAMLLHSNAAGDRPPDSMRPQLASQPAACSLAHAVLWCTSLQLHGAEHSTRGTCAGSSTNMPLHAAAVTAAGAAAACTKQPVGREGRAAGGAAGQWGSRQAGRQAGSSLSRRPPAAAAAVLLLACQRHKLQQLRLLVHKSRQGVPTSRSWC